MASLLRAVSVVGKGHYKEQLPRFAENVRVVALQGTFCFYSRVTNKSTLILEVKQFLKSTTWRCSSLKSYSSLPDVDPNTSSPFFPRTNSATRQEITDSSYAHPFNPALVEELTAKMEYDMPVSDMLDPFEKSYHRCFLCRQNIQLDHKNVRLLSQFVSPFTGRIYGRAITGLCIPMQKQVAKLIKRARVTGFMPIILKDPKYLQDPQPYDAMAKRN